jgi:replicative DNA helicase
MTDSAANAFQYPIEVIRQLLNLITTDRKSFIALRTCLHEDLFGNDVHKYLYNKVEDFYDAYKELPEQIALDLDLKEDLQDNSNLDYGMAKQEIDLIRENECTNKEWLRTKVVEYVQTRAIMVAVEKTFEYTEKKKYLAVPDLFKEVLKIQQNPDRIWLLKDAKEWLKTIELTNPIPASLPTITRVLGGGYNPGELTIYMAKTNVGKSIQLVREAQHARSLGYNVFFATCEMASTKIAKRLISAEASKSFQDIESKYSTESMCNYFNIIKDKTNSDICIAKYKPGELTGAKLLADVYEAQASEEVKFDIIVVDYIDEMSPNQGKTSSDYENQRHVCEQIIATAEELDVPLVSATQATRSGGKVKGSDGKIESVNLDTEDVGDSYWVSRLAHVIVTMNQTAEMRAAGSIRYYIAKNREGEKGIEIDADISYPKMLIREKTKPGAEKSKKLLEQHKETQKSLEEKKDGKD